MSALPADVVTFLFTDVAGSARLWEAAPRAMSEAMARHDDLIQSAVETAGGTLVRPRGEGDSRFAVFTSAPAALVGALDISIALAAEPWSTPAPIRVRAALGTGEAELRAGDYYGDAVNRCARLRAAGHPGQVLVADTTARLARDSLPVEMGLVDLGLHRLKDLSRPERIHQLTHPELVGDFPPLLTLNRAKHNLPFQLSSFVGRDADVAAVHALLDSERLVTITGFGGMGKTRLALQMGAELANGDGDGAWFVDLSAARDPARVPAAIAETLGIAEAGERVASTVVRWLTDKRLLLILDNLEQIPGCASFVADVLGAAPDVKVLATSRAPLRIRGEHSYELSPLAVPEHSATSPDRLTESASVRLFVDRAVEARHDFGLTTANSSSVAAICTRLDGHPLSIELAAARVKALAPEALLPRLSSALKVLPSSGGDRPDRQKTVAATIAWSYDALPPGERLLLDCLSVFPETATLDAIETVCGSALAGIGAEVVDALTNLVENSLVRIQPPNDTDPAARYRLLVPIRDYATGQLAGHGALAACVRRQHGEYFFELTARVAPDLEGTANGTAAMAILKRELMNIRAALSWAADDDPGLMLELVGQLRIFFWLAGLLREGLGWVEAAVEGAERAGIGPTDARFGHAWEAGAWLATHAGDTVRATQYGEACESLRRTLGDDRGVGRALELKARAALTARDYGRARPLFMAAGEFARKTDDLWTLTAIAMNMGDLCLQEGDFEGAYACAREGLEISEPRGDLWGCGISALNVAQAAVEMGRCEEARARLMQGLGWIRGIGYTQLSASYISALAAVEVDRDPKYAVILLGISGAVLDESEEALQNYELGLRERAVAAARAQLDADEFDAAWAEGHATDLDDAVDALLNEAEIANEPSIPAETR